ncbi:MAG: HEAT repeat domain-containing protein, partial [Bdellovibrionales bacterium]|nr:HEAT repeat domain-containing protein [Bdellovibrionales bacterium]
VMGTPAYMAPEQIRNEALDYKCDLFSFAVVAYECFAGKRPFEGENFTAVMSNILNSPPKEIRDFNPNLPSQIQECFVKAMAKSKSDRYESAGEFVLALASVLGLTQIIASVPVLKRPRVEDSESSEEPRRRKRTTSKWKRIRARKYSDLSIDEQFRRRKRTPTSEYLSPWREQKQLVDEYGRLRGLTPATHVNTHSPGEVLFGQGSGMSGAVRSRTAPQFSPMFLMTVVLVGVSGVLASVLLYLVFFDGSPSDSEISKSEPRKSLAEIGVDSPLDVPVINSLPMPEVDPVPLNLSVESMTNRQILGVLVSGGMPDDLVFAALREGENRKVPGLVEACHYALQSDSYLVRIEAIKTAAHLADKRIVPSLMTVLEDHDPLVREQAAKALGILGDSRAVGYLSTRLRREDHGEVKLAIKKAIERINGFPG